jgi:hypothetical protein
VLSVQFWWLVGSCLVIQLVFNGMAGMRHGAGVTVQSTIISLLSGLIGMQVGCCVIAGLAVA